MQEREEMKAGARQRLSPLAAWLRWVVLAMLIAVVQPAWALRCLSDGGADSLTEPIGGVASYPTDAQDGYVICIAAAHDDGYCYKDYGGDALAFPRRFTSTRTRECRIPPHGDWKSAFAMVAGTISAWVAGWARARETTTEVGPCSPGTLHGALREGATQHYLSGGGAQEGSMDAAAERYLCGLPVRRQIRPQRGPIEFSVPAERVVAPEADTVPRRRW